MQIMQVPAQPASNVVTQPQTLTNTLPNVLTQAVQPISQRALPPTEKVDKGAKARRRGERERGNSQQKTEDGRGGFVNIDV